MCLLGTFSPYITVHQASVVRIEPDIPLDVAALVGCGVTTGWGSATKVAHVRPGENVVVIGAGGVGMNAVPGAAAAGAKRGMVVEQVREEREWAKDQGATHCLEQGAEATGGKRVMVIEPVAKKREWAMDLGATHVFESAEEATGKVNELTWGRMADKTIITVGDIQGEDIQTALSLTGKGGRAVVTGMGNAANTDVKLSLFELTLLQKDLQGAIFGGLATRAAIPERRALYQEGQLKLRAEEQ